MSFAASIILAVLLLATLLWWRSSHQRIRSEMRRLQRESEIRSREEAEKAAARASHQTALFDSMVEGVLLLDQDGRVQMVNASLRELFEIDTDITGKTLMEAFRLHELGRLTERLHDEGTVVGLARPTRDEFQVVRIGERDEEGFQDTGIEYYRYVVTAE